MIPATPAPIAIPAAVALPKPRFVAAVDRAVDTALPEKAVVIQPASPLPKSAPPAMVNNIPLIICVKFILLSPYWIASMIPDHSRVIPVISRDIPSEIVKAFPNPNFLRFCMYRKADRTPLEIFHAANPKPIAPTVVKILPSLV